MKKTTILVIALVLALGLTITVQALMPKGEQDAWTKLTGQACFNQEELNQMDRIREERNELMMMWINTEIENEYLKAKHL